MTPDLKFPKGVDDDGTGDAHAVSDTAGYQDTFVALQLLEDMGNSLQLRE